MKLVHIPSMIPFRYPQWLWAVYDSATDKWLHISDATQEVNGLTTCCWHPNLGGNEGSLWEDVESAMLAARRAVEVLHVPSVEIRHVRLVVNSHYESDYILAAR